MSIANNPHTSTTNPPGWLWLLTGAILGLFIAFLVYLSKIPFDIHQGSLSQTHTSTQQKLIQTIEPAEPPKFTFYTQLPRAELFPQIAYPEATKPAQTLQIEPSKEKHTSKPASANPTTPLKLIVQSGAFKDPKQAERQKVDLILMGLSPIIQSVTTVNGITWHRVTFGPFNNIEQASTVAHRLKELKLNPTTYRP